MKKIIVNMAPWETRVAVTRNDKLENVYFGASTDNVLERSFFKGKVAKVFPGIQTAFVEIGQEKSGFLHISEVDRELALKSFEEEVDDESGSESEKRYVAPDISTIFKEDDEILVQVNKEPVGQKGAKLTTCFTLPGRFLVLMPNIPRICVSKKIEDREERARLKQIFQYHLPEGMGAIIRTSAEGVDESEIFQDVTFLLKDWESIQTRFKKVNAPAKIYEDMDISLQVVRDYLDDDVEMIITDNVHNQEQLYLYIKSVAPEHQFKVQLYEGQSNIFEHFNIDTQIKDALTKKVDLKSGGSIVIESTEAMTVIDVNTGRFIGKKDLEDTVLTTNLQAAQEIVRQLRLRNIGGLIVIDFIDMAEYANREKLVEAFEHQLKLYDKFQSVVLNVSAFGLVQMTRKRSGKTLQQKLTSSCTSCHGTGWRFSVRTQSYEILHKAAHKLKLLGTQKDIIFTVHPEVFDFISSIEYNSILVLEKERACNIVFKSDVAYAMDQFTIEIKK
jgi:ribonuclease G